MSDTVALAFALIAHCLCNLNSAINPVIYYLMSGKRSVYICARAAHCAYSINENEKTSDRRIFNDRPHRRADIGGVRSGASGAYSIAGGLVLVVVVVVAAAAAAAAARVVVVLSLITTLSAAKLH